MNSRAHNTPAARLVRSLPIVVALAVAHLLFGTGRAEAICSATSYTATGASGNWTDTSGSVWSPSGNFPGSCAGDSAFDSATGGTITVSSPIANPLDTLNFSCTACGIDIASGGFLALGNVVVLASGVSITVQAGGSFLVSSSGTVTVPGPLNNNGLVSEPTTGGTLILTGGGSGGSAATFSATGGKIRFNSGTYTLGDSVTLFTSGTGEIDLDGTGELTIGSGDTVTASNFVQSAGTLDGPGTFIYGMNSQWNGGSQSGAGFTYVSGGAILTMNGTAATTLDGRALVVQGTLDYTGTPSPLEVDNGATIINLGTFNLEDDSPINSNLTLNPTFSNLGLLTKVGGSATSTIDLPVANGGTIDVSSSSPSSIHLNGGGSSTGVFSISDPASSIAVTAGTFTIGTGATQTGLGALDVLTSGTLVIGANFTSPNFSLTGGTVHASGADTLFIPMGSVMNWNGGTLAQANVDVGGSLNLFTGNAELNGSALFIDSGATLTFESGHFDMENFGFLQSFGTFDIQCNCTIDNNDGDTMNTTTNTINNWGVFQKSGSNPALKTGPGNARAAAGRNGRHPAIVMTPGPALIHVIFNEISFGGNVLQALDGTIGLDGGGTNAGTFSATAGSGIDFPTSATGQTYEFADGSTFTGDGTLSISGGVLNVDGDVTASNLALKSGTLQGGGDIDAQETLVWSGGTMSGSGTTEGYPPAIVTIDGALDNMILDGRTLDIQGIANYTSSTNTLSVVDSANVLVEFGGTFDIQNDADLVSDGSGTFTNEGTLDKSAGSATSFGPALTNTGSLLAEAGAINFSGGFTQNGGVTTLSGGGAIGSTTAMDFEGGELNGDGTVAADVTNAATVQPGDDTMTTGSLLITGNYTQKPAGIFNVKIGGTTAGSEFDQLNVTGTATLDGTINATLINSFTPAMSDTFQVLTFGAHSGDFATKNFPTFNGTQSLTESLSATAATLSVVSATADLGVTETGPSSILHSQNAVYSVVVTNFGPSVADTVTMTDDVTGIGTVISATGTAGSCTGTAPVVCTVPTLASGASVTFTITVQPDQPSGTITSAVSVSSLISDSNNANDTDSVTTTVSPDADLSLTIVDDVDPVDVNGTVNYTATVSNAGPDDALAPSVLFSITGAAGASSSSAGWDCSALTATGGTCTATGPLTASASSTIDLVVTAPSNGGTITIHGTVSSATGDPANGNNSATQSTTVNAIADLGVTKTGPTTAVSGDTVTYTITIQNGGPSDASAVIVSDPTPAGLQFVSNSGGCATAFPCNVGLIPNGSSKTVTSRYSVRPGAPSTIVNTASVTFSGTDPNTTNNSSQVSTDVTCNVQTPDEIAPLPGAVNVSPDGTFRWENTGAATYSVFVGPVGSGCNTLLGTSSSPSLAYSLDPTTTYQWRVVASTAGCADRTSACNTFTTGTRCMSGPPTLIAPVEGATVSAPVDFSWSVVTGATNYELFASINGADPISLGSTTATTLTVDSVGDGSVTWFVVATVDMCSPLQSADGHFNTCTAPEVPVPSVVGEVITDRSYEVSWDAVDHAASYEIDEADNVGFVGTTTQTTSATAVTFSHSVSAAQPFFYRVRSVPVCGSNPGQNSATVRVVVVPFDITAQNPNIPIPAGGTDSVTWTVFVPAPDGGPFSFTATTDQPWVTVVPGSGTLRSPGTTFQLTADPSNLPDGTNTATLVLALGESAKARVRGTPTTVSVPVSVTLATPVSLGSLSTPTADTIIVPSIAHVAGLSSHWQSDIRVSNPSTHATQYRLSFVPGGSTGKTQQTTIHAAPGSTIALDDIVQKWYGIGSLGDGGSGMLEISPINNGPVGDTTAAPSVQTVVSSRTYDSLATDSNSSNGTLGQFIPGISFSSFVGAPAAQAQPQLLSLQQLTQNDSFRTNLGIVEAAGLPVTLDIQAFDDNGVQLFELPMNLMGGEQKQINQFLEANNISIDDSRLQISVTSGTGKITAFASVIDNRTLDPLLVSAANLSGAGATDFALPGVANLNSGTAQWRTDMRIFNAGVAAQQATLTFYPLNGAGTTTSKDLLVHVGEVASLDDVLASFFGITNAAGIVHVSTPAAANLVVTGKTFDSTPAGTYGQFIPAFTTNDAITLGGRTLQILQVEDSVRYRTNVGIAEISGKPATVEITVVAPGALSAPVIRIPLAAYEYQQFDPITAAGLQNVYDGRITVRVVSGDGSVTAYGSIVDMTTQDPTYVPAQ